MINIVVADNHQLTRSGIIKLITQVKTLHVSGEAESGEKAIHHTKELKPDILLINLNISGMGSLEATHRILKFFPKTKVIGLATSERDPLSSQFLKTGAQGCLTQQSNQKELVMAIIKVHTGHQYVTPSIAQKIALSSIKQQTPKCPFDLLSTREMQITLMVITCLKVAEISNILHLSPKTVNSYRYRIFEKLDISSDVELTLLAIKHKIINPELQD